MTEDEREKIYWMSADAFMNIKNPTLETCLVWLRSYHKKFRPEQLRYIPIEHRELCKIQLKLEGLL